MRLAKTDWVETGWACELAPLGIPTVVIADDPSLLQAAVAPYLGWEAKAPIARPTISIRLKRQMTPAAHVGFRIAVEGSRLSLTGDAIAGWADAKLGQAGCTVSSDLIADAAGLLSEAVDTLLLFLLARSGRTPVHASAIVMGERALLLAGPSGAGKSTLALAAARRGFPVLSDDTVYVQTEPHLRIWGLGSTIHVLSEDAPAETLGTRLRNGKLKLAVAVPRDPQPFADHASVILLERGGKPELVRASPDAAMESLSRLEPGFDLLREASAAAHRALLREGDIWKLTLSRDPGAAIELLCARFGGV